MLSLINDYLGRNAGAVSVFTFASFIATVIDFLTPILNILILVLGVGLSAATLYNKLQKIRLAKIEIRSKIELEERKLLDE